MYMIGGFNKMRVKLDTMVKFNLLTELQVECTPLPASLFKAAVAHWQGGILVVNGSVVYTYSIDSDTWSQRNISASSMPVVMEFHAITQVGADSFYLTSTYSRDIYSLRLGGEEADIEKVGQFKFEAQNPTCTGGKLYNFFTDDFTDLRVVEAFSLASG